MYFQTISEQSLIQPCDPGVFIGQALIKTVKVLVVLPVEVWQPMLEKAGFSAQIFTPPPKQSPAYQH